MFIQSLFQNPDQIEAVPKEIRVACSSRLNAVVGWKSVGEIFEATVTQRELFTMLSATLVVHADGGEVWFTFIEKEKLHRT